MWWGLEVSGEKNNLMFNSIVAHFFFIFVYFYLGITEVQKKLHIFIQFDGVGHIYAPAIPSLQLR